VTQPDGSGYTFAVPARGRPAQGAWWIDRRPPRALLAHAGARGHRGTLYQRTLGRERGLDCAADSFAYIFPNLPRGVPDGVVRRELYECSDGDLDVLLMEGRPGVDIRSGSRNVASVFGLARSVRLPCAFVGVRRVKGWTYASFTLTPSRADWSPYVLLFVAPSLQQMQRLICNSVRRSYRPRPVERYPVFNSG
jgi:hypothetical protein